MDNTRPWHQVYATFPEWTRAEPTVLARLVPQLFTAEGEGLIDAWFFIRKRPCWRVRYLPAADASAKAQARIEQHLDELTASQNIDGWTQTVYEPEPTVSSTATAAACWPTSRARAGPHLGTGARYPSCCAAS
jgi:hypothetical protein